MKSITKEFLRVSKEDGYSVTSIDKLEGYTDRLLRVFLHFATSPEAVKQMMADYGYNSNDIKPITRMWEIAQESKK